MTAVARPNPQQQAVIDHLEGPLRIIAGAGTGKTRTLTWRIQAIIEQELARPDQILALTFTEKAAAELRERIDEMTLAINKGPERVAVHTYHSFGASIIDEFGHLLELPPEPLLLTDAERWMLIWRSINEIAFSHIDYDSLRPNPYSNSSEIGNMLKLHDRLSDELKSLDDLDAFLKRMPSQVPEIRKLIDYAQALKLYQRRKAETGAIDYGDQIALAVELLERPGIADIFHDRFRFLMVDEFQDTNYAQAVMVKLLAPPTQQNVCVVGDPNQAIYLFRGASPDNLERFATSDFPDAVTLPLSENYRSYQQILDAANAVWSHGSNDALTRESLTSARKDAGPKPKSVTAPFRADEISWVADEIGRLIRSEHARPEDILVLARSNERKLECWRALLERNIRAIAVGGDALFALDEVQEVISWFKVIINRNNSEAFLHVLLMDRWGIDERDVFRWSASDGGDGSLADRLDRCVAAGEAPPPLIEFFETLDALTAISYQDSLTQLAQTIVGIRQGAYTPEERRGLSRFLEIINQFSSARVGNPTLNDLVEYLDVFQLAGGEEFDRSGENDDNAVQVMTAHRAKGLEKKIVFVVDSCGFGKNGLDDVLPPGLAHEVKGRPAPPVGPIGESEYDEFETSIKDWLKQIGQAEAVRVFYVAVTRAEDVLYVTQSTRVKTNKQKVPEFVQSLAELCEKLEVAGTHEEEPGLRLAAVLKTALIESKFDFDNPQIAEELREALLEYWLAGGGDRDAFEYGIAQFLREKTKLLTELETVAAIEQRREERLRDRTDPRRRDFSYTSLDQFEQCPHRFYLRYHLGLPGKPSKSATEFGSRFHEAVQREAERRRSGLPSEPVEVIRARLGQPGTTNAHSPEAHASLGGDPLASYLESPDATAEPLLIEKDFVLNVGEARINGIIDRVQKLPDGTIEVVDYKTNRTPLSEDGVKKGLQLPIYLLAVRECFPEIQPAPNRAKMFFVRHDLPVTVTYSDEELNRVRERLARRCAEAANVESNRHEASVENCRYCDYREVCRFSVKS